MENKREKKVIIFTAPGCVWCTRVKDYLRRAGVRFREVDISRDPRAAEDMTRRTGQRGVPVVLVEGRPVVGFDKEKLDRLLA